MAIRAIPIAFSIRRSISTDRRIHSAMNQIKVTKTAPMIRPRIAIELDDVTLKSESQYEPINSVLHGTFIHTGAPVKVLNPINDVHIGPGNPTGIGGSLANSWQGLSGESV